MNLPCQIKRRRESRQIMVGDVAIGGNAPISVQSMTNTDTRDVSATLAQVKKRYRELALKHHPDKNEPAIKTKAEKKFVRINQAYETIMGAA